MRYVVTLVHGTFARNANWIQTDSLLSTSVMDAFPGRATIVPFVWSGHNSLRARQRATAQLREQLVNNLKLYPTASHFVVGHSHGGSVALNAVTGVAMATKISGVICLSTPFLYVRPRENTAIGNIWSMAVCFGLPILCLIVWMLLASAGSIGRISANLQAYLLVATIWLALGLYFFVSLRWKRFAAGLCAPEDPGAASTVPVKIIRTVGDEAGSLLTAAQFAAWIMRRLAVETFRHFIKAGWAPVKTYVAYMQRLIAWLQTNVALFFSIVAIAYCGTVWLIRVVSREPLSHAVIIAAVYAFLLPCVLLAVLPLTIIPRLLIVCLSSIILFFGSPLLLLMSIIALLPFGWDVALNTIWLDVTVETTPPGDQSCRVTVLPSLGFDSRILRHSAIYDDARTGKEIVQWMSTIG